MPDPITILAAIGAALAASAFAVVVLRVARTQVRDCRGRHRLGGGNRARASCSAAACWARSRIGRRSKTRTVCFSWCFRRQSSWSCWRRFRECRGGLIWLLRVALAAGVAPVLLHGTSLPERPGWSRHSRLVDRTGLVDSGRSGGILDGGLGSVGLLSARVQGVSPAVCLAISSAGAGLAIMISGYMSRRPDRAGAGGRGCRRCRRDACAAVVFARNAPARRGDRRVLLAHRDRSFLR